MIFILSYFTQYHVIYLMGQEFEDIFESSLKTEKYVWSVKCEGEHSGVVVSTTSQPS